MSTFLRNLSSIAAALAGLLVAAFLVLAILASFAAHRDPIPPAVPPPEIVERLRRAQEQIVSGKDRCALYEILAAFRAINSSGIRRRAAAVNRTGRASS
jgi:hypothetical protein